MGFSFNWAGVNVPQIQGGSRNYQQTIRSDAQAAGNMVRGYEQRKAAQEYADILGGNANEVASIKAEIARLEQRNAELEAQVRAEEEAIARASEQASQQMAGYTPVSQQMAGYGAYQQGMQNQGINAANMLAALQAQNYRMR